MTTAFGKRLLFVWLLLSSMTVGYLWLDHSADHDGRLLPSAIVTVSVMAIALVKVRIIFREFMEVRQAPVLLRRLTDAWVALMAVFLFGSYLLGAVGSN